MSVKTFAASVTNGQLRFQESLADFEGQQVLVTLAPSPCHETTEPPCQPCPPAELDVEHNVVLRMPFRWEPVQARAVDAGSIRPSMIVPEDLPDE